MRDLRNKTLSIMRLASVPAAVLLLGKAVKMKSTCFVLLSIKFYVCYGIETF